MPKGTLRRNDSKSDRLAFAILTAPSKDSGIRPLVAKLSGTPLTARPKPDLCRFGVTYIARGRTLIKSLSEMRRSLSTITPIMKGLRLSLVQRPVEIKAERCARPNPFMVSGADAARLQAIETADPGKPDTTVHNGCEVLPSLIGELSEESVTIRTEEDLMAFHRQYCGDRSYMNRALAFGAITTKQFCDYADRAEILIDKPISEFNPKEPKPVQVVRVALARPLVHD